VVGSLYYVSPEQLLNRKIDGRSDVYALGVSMYEMLSGQRPFRGQTFTELSTNIIKGACPPLGQLEPNIPLEVERVVARAMTRDVDERYASAADLWHELCAVQAALGPRPQSFNGPTSPAAPRHTASPWAAPSPDATLIKQPARQTLGANRPAHRTLRPASLEPAPPEDPGTER
jgi:serine/threonine-protein kinase